MTRIGIIVGSTRPNRNSGKVARWVQAVSAKRGDAEFEVVDLRDHRLPHLDEPMSAAYGHYQHWAATISAFNGFVIVSPEYNHGIPGVLENALDYLYAEWNNKAVGFVTSGGVGGARAAEHLRTTAGELQMADVRRQVTLSLGSDFENYTDFAPRAHQTAAVNAMIDQVIAWSTALAPVRAAATAA
ncbi:hypothetical protein GCM10023094_54940 [Rhodococcus olei]|uniref:NADPH-dependent FMN reductase-like domain-containing protein n=1 Tax=Rhodococcus olei TaxID=2161675 RepID=A0ABP8PRK0_9NOCA